MGSRLYIGRLHQDVRDRDLDKLFGRYGRIVDLRMMTGFGFVEFREERDARDAVREMDGKEFFGERLLVQFARRERRGDARFNPPERTGNRLIVSNLASGTSWQDLKDLVRSVGDVTFADIFRGGEGVVEFRSGEDMRRAIKDLQGTELRGSKIALREGDREGDRRDDRQVGGNRRSRSRSPRRNDRYGGGRRRSRSRSRSPRRDDRYGGSSGGRRRSRSRSPRREERTTRRSSRSRSVSRQRSPARNTRSYDRSPSPRGRSASPSRERSPNRVWDNAESNDRAASPANPDWDNNASINRDEDATMQPAGSPGRSRSRSPFGQDRD